MSRDYEGDLTRALLRRIPQLSPEDAQVIATSMLDEVIDATSRGGRPTSITQNGDGSIDMSYLFIEDPLGDSKKSFLRRRFSFRRRPQ